VSLSRWKQLPGIFLWVLLSAIQAAEATPHGIFLKSMVKGVMTYLAVDHWDVVDAAGMGFVGLQRWLRSKDYGGDGEAGSRRVFAYLSGHKIIGLLNDIPSRPRAIQL
jgi:hypothetical protein